jgi:hypothetical protein
MRGPIAFLPLAGPTVLLLILAALRLMTTAQ